MDAIEETVELAVPLSTAFEQWTDYGSAPGPLTASRDGELVAWPGGRVTFHAVDAHTTRLVLRAAPDHTPQGLLARFKEFVEHRRANAAAGRQYWRVERA